MAAVTSYNSNPIGGLSALAGDLIRTDPRKNSYLKQTYSYDPAALNDRMGQYNVYDKSKLGALADYFAPKAATTIGNQMYIKPADFTSLSDTLGGIKDSDLDAYRPMLGGLQPVGSYGGQTYFDKGALEKVLGGYAGLSGDDYAKYSALSKVAALNPVTTVGGNRYYDKDAFQQALNSYHQIDPSKLGDDVVSQALKSHAAKLGDGYFLDQDTADYYKNFADAMGKSQMSYYGVNKIMDPFDMSKVRLADYPTNATYPDVQLNVGGQDYIYVPYEMASRIQGSSSPGKLNYYLDFLGNEDIFNKGRAVNLTGDIVDQIKNHIAGTTYPDQIGLKADNLGQGYLFTPGEYWSGQPDSILAKYGSNVYDANMPVQGSVSTGRASHDYNNLQGARLIRNYDPKTGESLNLLKDLDNLPSGAGNNDYINKLQAAKWFAQSESDPNLFTYQNPDGTWGRAAYDTWTEIKKKGGWGGPLGSIANTISDAMKGPLGAVVSLAFPTFAAGYYMANGATNAALGKGNLTSNLLSAIGGAMGLSGAGSALSSSIGNATGLGATASNAISNGLINTGMNVVAGRNIGDALKSGLVSGLASYGGGALNSALRADGMNPYVAGTLSSTAAGGLGALLSGRNIGQGLATGAINGIGNSVGSLVSGGKQPTFGGALSNIGARLLLNNLAGNRNTVRRG